MRNYTLQSVFDNTGREILGGEVLELTGVDMHDPTCCHWEFNYDGSGLVLSVDASAFRYTEPVVRILADNGTIYNIGMGMSKTCCRMIGG
jgi:hypothetical protein